MELLGVTGVEGTINWFINIINFKYTDKLQEEVAITIENLRDAGV